MNKLLDEMLVCEILDEYPALEEVFIKYGLNCVGCPGSNNETLREAASGHGVDLDMLVSDIKKVLE